MTSAKTPSLAFGDNCVAKIVPLAKVDSGFMSVRSRYLQAFNLS